MKNQVPEEDILIEEESLTTRENLQNAKKLMEENHLADAIIVSDPIHMRRAMQIANDLGIKAWSSPTPSTKYASWQAKIHFLFQETMAHDRLHRLSIRLSGTGYGQDRRLKTNIKNVFSVFSALAEIL